MFSKFEKQHTRDFYPCSGVEAIVCDLRCVALWDKVKRAPGNGTDKLDSDGLFYDVPLPDSLGEDVGRSATPTYFLSGLGTCGSRFRHCRLCRHRQTLSSNRSDPIPARRQFS